MFEDGEINVEMIEKLKQDKRKGVQQLLKKYEREELKKEKQLIEFNKMMHYERLARQKNRQLIAGVDEAGRGPLAGPVVAASVVLPEDFLLLGLNDSKQLTEKEREEFYLEIIKQAISYHITILSNEEIDKMNILEATKKAMYGAIYGLNPQPEHVLVDAVALTDLSMPSDIIIKGDEKSVSIAAASILAKVTRDRLMQKIHEEFPMYEFNKNMGYGTKKHIESIHTYGVSPYHRKTFAPIRDIIDS